MSNGFVLQKFSCKGIAGRLIADPDSTVSTKSQDARMIKRKENRAVDRRPPVSGPITHDQFRCQPATDRKIFCRMLSEFFLLNLLDKVGLVDKMSVRVEESFKRMHLVDWNSKLLVDGNGWPAITQVWQSHKWRQFIPDATSRRELAILGNASMDDLPANDTWDNGKGDQTDPPQIGGSGFLSPRHANRESNGGRRPGDAGHTGVAVACRFSNDSQFATGDMDLLEIRVRKKRTQIIGLPNDRRISTVHAHAGMGMIGRPLFACLSRKETVDSIAGCS